jgi:hypothetical protein
LNQTERDEVYVGLLDRFAVDGVIAPRGHDFGETASIQKDDRFFRGVATKSLIRAAGEDGVVQTRSLIERARRSVAVDQFTLEKLVEVHRAAARDLFAIVDAIRQRVVLCARQVDVAGGDARCGGALTAIERTQPRRASLNDDGLQLGGLAGHPQRLRFERERVICLGVYVRDLQRLITAAGGDELVNGGRHGGEDELAIGVGRDREARIDDRNANAARADAVRVDEAAFDGALRWRDRSDDKFPPEIAPRREPCALQERFERLLGFVAPADGGGNYPVELVEGEKHFDLRLPGESQQSAVRGLCGQIELQRLGLGHRRNRCHEDPKENAD